MVQNPSTTCRPSFEECKLIYTDRNCMVQPLVAGTFPVAAKKTGKTTKRDVDKFIKF